MRLYGEAVKEVSAAPGEHLSPNAMSRVKIGVINAETQKTAIPAKEPPTRLPKTIIATCRFVTCLFKIT
jgi:hypothetical protein